MVYDTVFDSGMKRRKEDYLVLNEPRDVIEWQLDELLGINGRDLKKVLSWKSKKDK